MSQKDLGTSPRTDTPTNGADRLRRLVEGVTDYAIVMLDPSGIVISWNAGAQRLHGYASDEIVGDHVSRLYASDDQAGDVPARALEIAAREGRHDTEVWHIHRDGHRFLANVIIDAIRDEQDRVIGFAAITHDLSDHQDAQAQLRKAEAQLAHAMHDFNNLLTIVSGHIRTIRKLIGDDPKGLRAVEAIEHAATRGEALTRELLATSKH